jgi:hypothetical protein
MHMHFNEAYTDDGNRSRGRALLDLRRGGSMDGESRHGEGRGDASKHG